MTRIRKFIKKIGGSVGLTLLKEEAEELGVIAGSEIWLDTEELPEQIVIEKEVEVVTEIPVIVKSELGENIILLNESLENMSRRLNEIENDRQKVKDLMIGVFKARTMRKMNRILEKAGYQSYKEWEQHAKKLVKKEHPKIDLILKEGIEKKESMKTTREPFIIEENPKKKRKISKWLKILIGGGIVFIILIVIGWTMGGGTVG